MSTHFHFRHRIRKRRSILSIVRQKARRWIQKYHFHARVKASYINTVARLHKLDLHKEVRNARLKLYTSIRCLRPRLNLLGEQYRKRKLDIKDIIKGHDVYKKPAHLIRRR